jgi:thiamine transport system permease protein
MWRLKDQWLAHLCGVIAALFLLLALLYPLAVILLRSFESWPGVMATVQNPYYWQRLWFTTWQALVSTLLTVALGLPGALLFARYDFWGKRLLRSAFTIPFVMPTVVAAIGFLALIGPTGLLGVNLRGTLVIVLLAHVFYNYAIVVRIVSSSLEGARQNLFDAAATLGAGRWRTLWQVTLPLALPALIAAATLVFIFCFTSFGVIVILAPGARFATLEVEIYRLSSRLLQLESAGLLVLVQLVVISLFTLLYTRTQSRLSLSLSQDSRPLPRPRGWARLALLLNGAVAGLLVLSPLIALTVQTFWTAGLIPTLRNFRYLAEAQPTINFAGAFPAILNSLRFAGLSTGLALIIGFCFAYAVARGGWRLLDNLSLLPLATSAVTLGFGYLLAFPQLRATIWGMTLAHTLIAFPFVARSLLPAMRSLPMNLRFAAATLGAGQWRTLWRIELPLLTGAMITASSFAFAISMGEFGATLTLQPARYATLPVAIFDRLGRPGARNYGSALALATLLMLITGLMMLFLERFGESEL